MLALLALTLAAQPYVPVTCAPGYVSVQQGGVLRCINTISRADTALAARDLTCDTPCVSSAEVSSVAFGKVDDKPACEPGQFWTSPDGGVPICATPASGSVPFAPTLVGGPDAGMAPTNGSVPAWNGDAGVWAPATLSAAAGGSNTQVQYNASGVLGGVSTVTSNGTSLIWTQTAVPAAPTAGSAIPLFYQHVSGSPAPFGFVDGASGLDWHMFPLDMGSESRWGCVLDPTFAATALTLTGWGGAGSATGTASAGAWATTDEWTRAPRVQWASATTASSSAGLRANIEMFNVGASAGRGGFTVFGSFRIETSTTNQRLFVGVKDATAVITATANPSAQLDVAYFGCDAGQTTIRRCTNDNSGAATCADLGASFPCTTVGARYNFFIWSPPGGGSVGFALERTDSAATAIGTASSDLPRNSVQLSWDLWINNGGTAAASTIQSTGLCYVMNP
jgi:hypothetical protein